MFVDTKKNSLLRPVRSGTKRLVRQFGNAVTHYNEEKILNPAQWSLPFKGEIAFHEKLTVPWLKKYPLPLMETKNPISLSWSPAPDSVPSCMSPVYSRPLYFLVICCYIIPTSMSRSSKWSLSFWFPINVLLISSSRPFQFSLVLSPYGLSDERK